MMLTLLSMYDLRDIIDQAIFCYKRREMGCSNEFLITNLKELPTNIIYLLAQKVNNVYKTSI